MKDFIDKVMQKAGNLIIWASAYLSVIVFALCGGYAWFKTDDESLKNETKKALLILLLFTAVGLIQSFVGELLNLFDVSYSSWQYSTHIAIANIISIIKIVTFAVFAVLTFVKKDDKGNTEQTAIKNEESAAAGQPI